ncbi:MAG: hypothetical protein HY318_17485 [Armatimonadetes bacterium]|nr:hypothetical protein [Armatimonadota bacterium]
MKITRVTLVHCLLCSFSISVGAATLHTGDGLALDANLPSSLTALSINGTVVSQGKGGLSLIDPRTGGPPAAGRFSLTAAAKAEGKRVVLSGVVTATGNEETVCQLQARIPVGEEGWLWWDDMSRSRAIRQGEGYVQAVYPLCCVTDPTRRLGLAVGLDPDPLQPATLSYDPNLKCIIVNWFLGFTPRARPEYRMRAPFRIVVYRVLPKWAFRSALDRYYHFHPKKFDWRARHEGLWLFASASESLPNPQHYAYNEGGPPPTNDLPRGLATFPYTCCGDIIVALPPEWGVPKNYDGMMDRLSRWEKIPRLTGWDELSNYDVDASVSHAGERSLRLQSSAPDQMKQVRQTFDMNQREVDPVTVSVWFKAQEVAGPKDLNCGLWIDMAMSDGENQFGKVVPGEVGTHDWQQLKIALGADKPIANLRAYLLFRQGHKGTVWFDDFAVTAASNPEKNLATNGDFESKAMPWQSPMIRDNVMYDESDHMRYFADTWGGADVPPASPINWLRYVLLVNPDQKNPEGRPTASSVDLEKYKTIFEQWPQCRGAYLDGTSGWSTTGFDYCRDHFPCFNDPFQYLGNVYRPCASGMASVVRWVDEFKKRFPGKLAFGNVWASNRMFPMCMGLDVCGYESSRWYDLEYADYYRAAAYHKPGLYLNYFRIGQQLDTRDGGEKFFRYATAYGLSPSIGRFTDEAYQKFGDLQHLYIPIVKHLFRAGWEPVTHAEASDPVVRVQRFGTRLPMYFTLLNPSPAPREVELVIDAQALRLKTTSVVAVEMVGSESVALSKHGASLTTKVTLGPEDVAVVALLPAKGVGAWYRERAAESLQGAAYVYAQTPPTAEAAVLAKRVSDVKSSNVVSIAEMINAVKTDLTRLRSEGVKLPEDLKRKSYLRDLDEADRLLNESLLADVGGRVGWKDGRIAPIDGNVQLFAESQPHSGDVCLTLNSILPGRAVEPAALPASEAKPEKSTGLICPPERALSAVADIAFDDASRKPVTLRRLGHAFFGPVCELSAKSSENASELVVHFRNSDTRPRQFELVLRASPQITLHPSEASLNLAGGESRDINVKVTFATGVKSGSYPVTIFARTDAGVVAERSVVPIVYALPLEAGNLALASAGANLTVDCFYFAYSEKPINDGVVNPVGVAFNAAAWASSEAVEDHWVEIQWQQPKTVGKAVIYWNVENEVVWTSKHVLVQVKEVNEWKTIAELNQRNVEPVTECRFDSVTTNAIRLLQPRGGGPVVRPNIMWLREVAVYRK